MIRPIFYEALAAAEAWKPLHRRNAALAHKYMRRRLGPGSAATTEARRHYETAVAIDRELLRASPQDPAAHMDLSYDLAALAKIDEQTGEPEAALAGLREALALRQWVLEQEPR